MSLPDPCHGLVVALLGVTSPMELPGEVLLLISSRLGAVSLVSLARVNRALWQALSHLTLSESSIVSALAADDLELVRYHRAMIPALPESELRKAKAYSLEVLSFLASLTQHHVAVWDAALIYAAKRNDLDRLKYCESQGSRAYTTASYEAARKGSKRVSEYLRDTCSPLHSYRGAAAGGNLEFLLAGQPANWNEIAAHAAQGGHLDCLKLAWERSGGMISLHSAAEKALLGRHYHVAEYCESKCSLNWQTLYEATAVPWDETHTEFFERRVAIDWNQVLVTSVSGWKLSLAWSSTARLRELTGKSGSGPYSSWSTPAESSG